MKNIVLSLIVLVSIAIIFSFMNENDGGDKYGPIVLGANTEISSKINEYMLETQDRWCANKLFGYDDLYAYSWIYCGKFTVNEYGRIIREDLSSKPARFEIRDSNIVNHEVAKDGSDYDLSVKSMFPKTIYSIAKLNGEEVEELEKELFQSHYQSIIPQAINDMENISTLFTDLEDWEFKQSFAGRGVGMKGFEDGRYYGYYTYGSGVPFANVICFRIDENNTVYELPSVIEEPMYNEIDLKNCKALFINTN